MNDQYVNVLDEMGGKSSNINYNNGRISKIMGI